jgi:hypothetical protein
VEKDDFTDEDIVNLVKMAETRGQPDPYRAVNKSSGALGWPQLMKRFHKDAIEKKYNIPFEQIVDHPEYQDDYFNKTLLPGYKKSTERIRKDIPESENYDDLTLTAIHQLGEGNVRKFLNKESDPNITKQMEHYLKLAEEYKKEKKFNKLKRSLAEE